MNFTCHTCGAIHDIDNITFGAPAPFQWCLLNDHEIDESELTPDQCVIRTDNGETRFFVRGCLDLPIRGTDRAFTWGVWVSVSGKSFEGICARWEDPDRVNTPPYLGGLCTRLPQYPDTLSLKTHVHEREVGQRPSVELEPTDHLLAVQQRQGVEAEWLRGVVEKLLHEES